MDDKLINKIDHEEYSQQIHRLLSTTYIQYINYQNAHWNVEDRRFIQLHKLFFDHYEEIFNALDEIAEVGRQLGIKIVATAENFIETSEIPSIGINISTEEMIATLYSNETYLMNLCLEITESSSLLIKDIAEDRYKAHSKNAWFLNTLLKS